MTHPNPPTGSPQPYDPYQPPPNQYPPPIQYPAQDPYAAQETYQQPPSPYQAAPYPPQNPYANNPYQGYPVQQRAGTNGFAIASLVLGIFGGILLSVIFGIVALVQIKNRGQRGKGLAVAGLSISAAWVALIAIGVAIAIANDADRDPQGNLATDGKVSIEDLRVGDCANGLKESRFVTRVDGVPCASPHESEVFAEFTLAAGTYPGEDEVIKLAEDGCAERFEDYAPKAKDVDELELFYLYPIRSSWSQGDRGVTCFATDPAGGRTGSLRD